MSLPARPPLYLLEDSRGDAVVAARSTTPPTSYRAIGQALGISRARAQQIYARRSGYLRAMAARQARLEASERLRHPALEAIVAAAWAHHRTPRPFRLLGEPPTARELAAGG